MVPTPFPTSRGTIELYFASCDAAGRGRPYVVEVDPERPHRALAPPRGPLLELGRPGCFDDNGVVPTSVVRAADGTIHLYYVGFELCHGVRYRLFTGLATSSDDGATFHRHSPVPVLCCLVRLVLLAEKGLEMFDLEDDVRCFTGVLPRVRIIPIEEFDPIRFL